VCNSNELENYYSIQKMKMQRKKKQKTAAHFAAMADNGDRWRRPLSSAGMGDGHLRENPLRTRRAKNPGNLAGRLDMLPPVAV
jgi:hypothetical protein